MYDEDIKRRFRDTIDTDAEIGKDNGVTGQTINAIRHDKIKMWTNVQI